MRVVVADDHTLVRQSVAKAARSEPGIEVVAEVADGPAALRAVASLDPDLVVLDIAMPGLDGLSVAEQLRDDRPDLAVLFLSMHDDDLSLQRIAGLKVSGFVSKSASLDELLAALRAVKAGRTYLSSDIAARADALAASDGGDGHLGLTAREREILELLTLGHRPADIADQLDVSLKTVKNHLTSVYHKLGVETGAQAVAEAYQRGLVRPS